MAELLMDTSKIHFLMSNVVSEWDTYTYISLTYKVVNSTFSLEKLF